MSTVDLRWYWQRLRRMGPAEVAWRARDQARRQTWRRQQVRHDRPAPPGPPSEGAQYFPTPLPPQAAPAVPPSARQALLDSAEQLLDGRGEILGVPRHDLDDPDWFLDPLTGRRAPQEAYAFGIDHRSEEETGNVKQVWELSRHHHLTLLSAAWFLSGDQRYAEIVARQLQSWWRQNPFLSGVHWTSGIELGIRLISWAWIRRLLDGWSGVAELFERNPLATRQIHWHQRYLSAFPSTGSSANNHVIAEAAGQLVASCAFPWFAESDRWRSQAATLLEGELERNTFPSGLNRELASDYHGFVTELALVAAVEAQAAGHPLGGKTWRRLCRMVDIAAAIVDERLRAPRQGDGDDGRVLVVDAGGDRPWASLLAAGARVFGSLPWWPAAPDDVRSALLGTFTGRQADAGTRPRRRSSHFADAGFTVLRTSATLGPEIWCRCDAGPHGYLAIAAHAHADALSIEVRHGGIDVLADPGTYCYHGEPSWRSYFRSTIGHNTLEVAGSDQSRAAGPFLWVDHATSRRVHVVEDSEGEIESWSAEHHGYRRLHPPAVHRRQVHLERQHRRLRVVDRVRSDGSYRCRLAFHLGPSVRASLEGSTAVLRWPALSGEEASATLALPAGLLWAAHRGETGPVLGWYSSSFGCKQPAVTLVGTGTCGSGQDDFVTILEFELRPTASRPTPPSALPPSAGPSGRPPH